MHYECPKCGGSDTKIKERMGEKNRIKCKNCGVSFTVKAEIASEFTSDKVSGIFNWREWTNHLVERKKLTDKSASSQDSANVVIDTPYKCIVLKPISDMHIGDIGTDYEKLADLTDEVLKIDYLYLSLTGDETDNFVSFKSQLAMLMQVMTPEQQDAFLESWLSEIGFKILFAGWGNHSEFEEKSSARNAVRRILSKNIVYFNGIGVCNLHLNDQYYKIVSTHKTRFNSSFNKTHGLKQLARREISDADVYIAGHTHDPSFEVSFERGLEQVYVVLGSLKHDDVFAKKYFSYFSARRDAALVFDSMSHNVIPFASLEKALEYAKKVNEGVKLG